MSKLYTVLLGHKFNEVYKGIKMYKLLNNNYIHRGFKYNNGLNIDTNAFNPSPFSKGGLYFCEESKCHMYMEQYGKLIAEIDIPNDSFVYVEDDKFKANKFIIKDIKKFDNVGNDFWIKNIVANVDALRFVKKQTNDLCLEAINIDYHALRYVKRQTEKICDEAVKKNGFGLEYVKKQTDKICLEAVKHNGFALRYVKKQTNEICVEAVKKSGMSLQYVNERTNEICLKAVKRDGLALEYVKEQTEEICLEAVRQNGFALEYVEKQTKEICIEAVKNDGPVGSIKICRESNRRNMH